jgi:hypothetical protein
MRIETFADRWPIDSGRSNGRLGLARLGVYRRM